ncbi:hypothetical protein [Methyloversatilis sp.]|uniref:hypothetical protein n=1 Tax=Methyloversatilis sp. TaxID=2569862 RepID=UPI003F70D1AF
MLRPCRARLTEHRASRTSGATRHPPPATRNAPRGREIVEQGFAIVDTQLPRLRELAGDFCIADAALFYVEFWAGHCGIDLPGALRTHARPAGRCGRAARRGVSLKRPSPSAR